MQYKYEMLGNIIKNARTKNNLTVEQLAEKIGISERYIYRIENENQKPSFDVLSKLIRGLYISADEIFYPDKIDNDFETETLIRMFFNCDERSREIVKATIKAALQTQI